jgi:hypothetical protein
MLVSNARQKRSRRTETQRTKTPSLETKSIYKARGLAWLEAPRVEPIFVANTYGNLLSEAVYRFATTGGRPSSSRSSPKSFEISSDTLLTPASRCRMSPSSTDRSISISVNRVRRHVLIASASICGYSGEITMRLTSLFQSMSPTNTPFADGKQRATTLISLS